MRIYYFGELIEENGRKVNELQAQTKTETQTALEFNLVKEPKKVGMPSIGELLEELDLSLDVYRPLKTSGTMSL